MQPISRQPIKINEGFKCEKCGKINPKAEKTCRNHCIYCLYSKHVDQNVPGDRSSDCGSLMEPVWIDYNSKKGQQIVHQCLKCGKKIFNKVAPDDNQDEIIKVISRQNMQKTIQIDNL